jgi:hypothetical protein
MQRTSKPCASLSILASPRRKRPRRHACTAGRVFLRPAMLACCIIGHAPSSPRHRLLRCRSDSSLLAPVALDAPPSASYRVHQQTSQAAAWFLVRDLFSAKLIRSFVSLGVIFVLCCASDLASGEDQKRWVLHHLQYQRSIPCIWSVPCFEAAGRLIKSRQRQDTHVSRPLFFSLRLTGGSRQPISPGATSVLPHQRQPSAPWSRRSATVATFSSVTEVLHVFLFSENSHKCLKLAKLVPSNW